MARLLKLYLKVSAKYLEREAYLEEKHKGDSIVLFRVMKEDVLINRYSGASKTLATLMSGISDVIQAEIAYRQFVDHQRAKGSRVQ